MHNTNIDRKVIIWYSYTIIIYYKILVIEMKDTKDIFISYRREDGTTFASYLHYFLQQNKFNVFFDKEDIDPGSTFPNRIKTAIENCKIFILVGSKSYFGQNSKGVIRIEESNDWVAQELQLAIQFGKKIVPVAVDVNAKEFIDSIPTKYKEAMIRTDSGDHSNTIENTNIIEYHQYDCLDIDVYFEQITKSFDLDTLNSRDENVYIEKLKKVGSEMDAEFPSKISKVVIDCNETVIENVLKPMLRKQGSDDLGLAAYYAIFTFYRKFKYVSKMFSFVEEYREQFKEHPYANVILTQYYKHKFLEKSNKEELKMAIDKAKECLLLFDNLPGINHAFADVIALALECDYAPAQQELDNAIRCIEAAREYCNKNNTDKSVDKTHPRYYCTNARLLFFKGEEDEAYRMIAKAIDLEDTNSPNAYIRITEYTKYLMEMKIRALKKEFLEKHEG